MGCYVMVGLASRRILLHPTTDHMVAQVFRLQQPHGGETSIRVSGRGQLAPASWKYNLSYRLFLSWCLFDLDCLGLGQLVKYNKTKSIWKLKKKAQKNN